MFHLLRRRAEAGALMLVSLPATASHSEFYPVTFWMLVRIVGAPKLTWLPEDPSFLLGPSGAIRGNRQ
jgi:hypothetical protein